MSTFSNQIETVLNNPSRIQSVTLNYLSELLAGKVEFIDPSNPFIAALECSAHHTASAVERNRVLTRRQYPRVAQTPDELYHHMTDLDYLDRFAQPTSAKFFLVMSLAELRRRMVFDAENNYHKVVIPRNTVFSVMDTNFSLSYPVEIRQMQHGGITIVYDARQASPVQELTTNSIEPRLSRNDGVDYMSFQVDVLQYDIVTAYQTITPATSFSITRKINEQFFYARVWSERSDGTWSELYTTHSDLVYDPAVPTAVLKVVGQDVTVTIPQIYTQEGTIVGRIRVDIYQTKGPLYMDLGGYARPAFSAQWLAIDKNDQTPFSSVLDNFEVLEVFSNSIVNGGRDQIDFEELRRRVIMNNTGPKHRPISPDQIETALVDKNYTIVKNIENLTNRVFLASRALPPPLHDQLITAAALSVQSGVFAIDDIKHLETVIDNGTAVTITPETIFQNTSGMLRILSQAEVNTINALSLDQRGIEVTNGRYYYTPFYYVLDFINNEFDVRAYYLSAPVAQSKAFVAENATTNYTCSTHAYTLNLVEDGFELIISTNSDQGVKDMNDAEFFAQLAYRPQNESDLAYVNGELVGKTDTGERLFRFHLKSTFNITRTHGLALTNFLMYDTQPRVTHTDLLNEFNIIYSTSLSMPVTWQPNEVDDVLGGFLLPNESVGINHELIRLEFGQAMEHLWTRARNFLGTQDYERYTENVYATYDKDIYETDPVTGTTVQVVNGQVVRNLLHAKGDPVLDSSGNEVILHYAGDTILDYNNNPIPIGIRKIQMQVDFMLVEGAYAFSNDEVVSNYRTELATILVDWIVNDIKSLTPELLEQTYIYFYPKTTTGNISVMYGPGLVTSMDASQSLRIDLHVDDKVHANEALRRQIEIETIEVVNEHFKKDVVAISDIIVSLRLAYAGDVIDVRVVGLGGLANYPIVSLVSETDRLSLRKRLKARPDGVLLVEEDISFNFVRHRLDKYDVI